MSPLPEVVGDIGLAINQRCGWLANAITELLEDDALRAVLSAKALARSKQFTWDLCAEKDRRGLPLGTGRKGLSRRRSAFAFVRPVPAQAAGSRLEQGARVH